MSRKILSVVAVGAFVVCAGYNVFVSQNGKMLSDLALANVEALASGEGDGNCRTNSNYTAICSYYNSGVICPCGF